MQKGVLFGLIVIGAFFLMGQGCYFNQLSTSSDALECEYTGQLFCADDGFTRVCSFINGQPHLETDGQLCNPETGELLADESGTPLSEPSVGSPAVPLIGPAIDLVVDFCDGLADGTYCDNNDLITCIAEDEETIRVVACSGICVDSNDGDAYCGTPASVDLVVDLCDDLVDGTYCDSNDLVTCVDEDEDTTSVTICPDICVDNNNDGNAYCDIQQVNPTLVAELNTFCSSLADGLYCYGSPNDVLVNCASGGAGVYVPCISVRACSDAQIANNPEVSLGICDPSLIPPPEADFCDSLADGRYCDSSSTWVKCYAGNVGDQSTCAANEECVENNLGEAECVLIPLVAPSTTGAVADFCDNKVDGSYCQNLGTLIYCAAYDINNEETCYYVTSGEVCEETTPGAAFCN